MTGESTIRPMRFFFMPSHLAPTDFRLMVPVADGLASCFVPALLRETSSVMMGLMAGRKISPDERRRVPEKRSDRRH
jgi:hypothetical protein